MTSFSGHASRWAGIGLTVMAVLCVLSWRLALIANRPAHLMAIATEVGSVGQFREGLNWEKLMPSSDGHALVYFKETETGLGAYLWSAAVGRSKLLYEQGENGFDAKQGFVIWSPEDRFVACSFTSGSDPQNLTRNIVLYDGNSGEPAVTVPVLSYSKFVWLSASSFAYTRYNQEWLVMKQNADGKWAETQAINGFGDGYFQNLTAISPHLLAWQQGGKILTYDLASGASEKIWESTTNKLDGFSCSRDSEDLLLKCSDDSGPLFIRFRPRRLWEKQGTIVSVSRNDSRPDADLILDHGQYCFVIKNTGEAEPAHFVWAGMADYEYRLAGDYLYFTGNPVNEPPGLWQYDVKTKETQCLDSGLKRPFQYTQMVTPISGTFTNASGEQNSYHLWAPIRLSRGKKYPLILGQTQYAWFPYEQVAANGEWFFAFADRPAWFTGISNWTDDVTSLYTILAKNPNIDTNRVFLFGYSAESPYLSQLVADKPDLWKGLMLFDPLTGPDLSDARLSKIFIASGADDGNAVKWLTRYQDEAARAGIPVRLILQTGSQHVVRSIATERERTRQLARMLMEN